MSVEKQKLKLSPFEEKIQKLIDVEFKVYVFQVAGVKPLKIFDYRPFDPYPISIAYDPDIVYTFTKKGLYDVSHEYPMLSLTPYNPITGEGRFTPFDVDVALSMIEEPKIKIEPGTKRITVISIKV